MKSNPVDWITHSVIQYIQFLSSFGKHVEPTLTARLAVVDQSIAAPRVADSIPAWG